LSDGRMESRQKERSCGEAEVGRRTHGSFRLSHAFGWWGMKALEGRPRFSSSSRQRFSSEIAGYDAVYSFACRVCLQESAIERSG
jgi:hypothetical protein